VRRKVQTVHTAREACLSREAGLKSQFSLAGTRTSCASRPVDVVYCTECTRDTAGLIIATTEHLAGEGQITWNDTYDPSCRRLTHVQRIDINGTVASTIDYDANRACTVYTPTAASGPPALDLSASGASVVDGLDRVLIHGALQFGCLADGRRRCRVDTTDTVTPFTCYDYNLFGPLQRVPFGTTATASGANPCAAALLPQPGTANVRRWIYADALNPVAQLDENNRVCRVS
jgi:hypothetical protein